jgi:hypothetical protein
MEHISKIQVYVTAISWGQHMEDTWAGSVMSDRKVEKGSET